MLLGDADALRAQPGIPPIPDLYDLVVRVICYHLESRRWPYEGALRGALRAHAAAPGRLGGVVSALALNDRAWLRANRAALLERSPEAAERVARWL